MNCLVACHSRLWIVTIVFYTCISIPLMQLKRALSTIFGLMLFFSYEGQTKGGAMEIGDPEIPSLPVARFKDFRCHCSDHGKITEEVCSICLAEFEGEDAVCKLGRCGHVFHVKCIEQWLECNQFTCPLCRSFLFSPNHIHTKK